LPLPNHYFYLKLNGDAIYIVNCYIAFSALDCSFTLYITLVKPKLGMHQL